MALRVQRGLGNELGDVVTSKPFETGTLAAAATSMAMIAQQVAGKAARDALFLSSFKASSLPFVMAAAAMLSLFVIALLSRLLARHSPAKVLPSLFASSATVLAIAWILGLASPSSSAVVVYLHAALFGPAVITSFWSLINERFDPHSAKRAVARIATGGAFGGILGGLAAWGMSTIVEPHTLLLLLAGLHAACVIGTLLIRAPKADGSLQPAQAPAHAAPFTAISPVVVLRTVPFLRNMALLVALGSTISALLDYIFSAQAATTIGTGQPLLAFFSLFGLGIAAVSFLLQMSLGSRVLEKLGLAWSMAMLPLVVVFGGAFGLLAPGLVSGALLCGSEMVQRNTLFRSAYELLYTPISEDRKRATKALIDIGFDRFGTVLGSGIVFIAISFIPEVSLLLTAVVVILALVALPLTRRLHRGYVAALEQGLQARAKELELPEVGGSTPSIAEKIEVVARDELIERVEEIRPGGIGGFVDIRGAERAIELMHDPRSLLLVNAELLSGDIDRTRRALQGWTLAKAPFTGFAILLLAHKTLNRDAVSALREVAPAMTGQLIDALLNPATDFVVRRRIPRVLAVCSSQRAADGILLGMADERFEVRYECGRALLRITARNASVVIARERVVDAILLEVKGKTAPQTLSAEFDDDAADDEPNELLELLLRDRSDRSLGHVFTLLSLHLEREPLRAAFQALHQGDVRHRGTALEYLATVLPIEVRDALWPFLGEASPLPEAPRAHEVLADVVRVALDQPARG